MNEDLPHINIDSGFILELPGLVGWKTEDSKYIATNQEGAHQLGFKRVEEIRGITDDKIRCPAAECAEAFVGKDKEVLLRNTEIELLDVNTWADNKRMLSYSKKKKFNYTEEGIKKVGTVFYSIEVRDTMLIKLAESLSKQIFGKNLEKSPFYCEIKNSFDYIGLSHREAQVLFFLVRGYTAKMIAKLLNISYRTVESYIEMIKLKLKKNTKNELVEFAYASGFILTIPYSLVSFLAKSQVL